MKRSAWSTLRLQSHHNWFGIILSRRRWTPLLTRSPWPSSSSSSSLPWSSAATLSSWRLSIASSDSALPATTSSSHWPPPTSAPASSCPPASTWSSRRSTVCPPASASCPTASASSSAALPSVPFPFFMLYYRWSRNVITLGADTLMGSYKETLPNQFVHLTYNSSVNKRRCNAFWWISWTVLINPFGYSESRYF